MAGKSKIAFDKFINVLIDVIHRGITICRYPWTPKSENRLDLSKFTLTFEDDFDGETLDETKWGRWGQGLRKGGFWDREQSFLRDGCLVIKSEYKENGKYGKGFYTDRVDTMKKFEQRYGYFEARCKLPASTGLWSAFWIFTRNINDFVPGKQGTEIDVFESPLYYRVKEGRDTGLVTSNIHYGGYALGHRYKNVAVTKPNSPYTEFNTYGVEWNRDGYIFYVNGVETGRSRFGGVSEVPQYMILSTEFDGVDGKPFYGWSGKATEDSPMLPTEFQIDYVRAYQYTDLLEKGE